MLKIIRNNKAQVLFGQYVLVFFLIVAAATGMSIYFKRAIQARIHDATLVSARAVIDGVPRELYVGNVYTQYEPYYLNTASDIGQDSLAKEKLFPSVDRHTGIFKKTIDDGTSTKTIGDTAPPRDAVGR